MAQSNSKLHWKKGFRKLPASIEVALSRFHPHNYCVVGCSKVIPLTELEEGRYVHLGIRSASDFHSDFVSVIPSPNGGPASFANATPIERIDKRRGKHSKLIRGRAPTPGRLTSHRTTYRRYVWHRTYHPPAMAHIVFKRFISEQGDNRLLVYFQIQERINVSDPECRTKILRGINLLQENVGVVDLLPAGRAEEESILRISEDIGWRVLPESEHRHALDRLISQIGHDKSERAKVIQDRFDYILRLNPRRILHSTHGFVGYFVIDFCDNLSVFENLEVDHAMYVVRCAADELSRLSRSQLKARLGADVERIIHSKGWKKRLASLVNEARGGQGPTVGDID